MAIIKYLYLLLIFWSIGASANVEIGYRSDAEQADKKCFFWSKLALNEDWINYNLDFYRKYAFNTPSSIFVVNPTYEERTSFTEGCFSKSKIKTSEKSIKTIFEKVKKSKIFKGNQYYYFYLKHNGKTIYFEENMKNVTLNKKEYELSPEIALEIKKIIYSNIPKENMQILISEYEEIIKTNDNNLMKNVLKKAYGALQYGNKKEFDGVLMQWNDKSEIYEKMGLSKKQYCYREQFIKNIKNKCPEIDVLEKKALLGDADTSRLLYEKYENWKDVRNYQKWLVISSENREPVAMEKFQNEVTNNFFQFAYFSEEEIKIMKGEKDIDAYKRKGFY